MSGNSKSRHSIKPDSSRDISRANSCTDSTSNDIIHIDSPNDFQPLVMSKSMTTEKENDSSIIQPIFGSDTFEPLPISSDESESLSSEKITNSDEKKLPLSSTKHYKQRKSSLKFLEQQNSIDSGDDNQQEINKSRYHKKSRIPRALSPIKSKQTPPPIVPVSNENFQKIIGIL